MTEQDLLWHYTNAAGLVGMLTEHKLWATSLSFMNDPGEADYAAGVLRQAARGIDNREGRHLVGYLEESHFDGYELGFSERFVLCASAAADSLDLWRSYGPTGVTGTFAVGLDRNSPLGLPNESGRGSSLATKAGWSDVRYESGRDVVARIREQLSAGIEDLRATLGTSEIALDRNGPELWQVSDAQFSNLVAVGKHEAYRSEREARLVWKVDCGNGSAYRIRPGRFGPIAYVEATSVADWGDTAEAVSPLPIREVIVWPGAPRAALSGVAAALARGGFDHDKQHPILNHDLVGGGEPTVRVRVSEVPLVQGLLV